MTKTIIAYDIFKWGIWQPNEKVWFFLISMSIQKV